MLEVCIDSLESAQNAIAGGAEELEICSSLTEGGLTPSAGLVKQVIDVAAKKPKINIMIRCRTGSDFCYTCEEMETMLSDIEILKQFTPNRFVFGALTEDQSIDIINCNKVIEKAKPIPVTFHRAFDVCKDPLSAVDEIIKIGFTRLLTSGQRASVNDQEAMELIKTLVNNYGDKIEVMPGAGINVDNAKPFVDLGCKIVHGSCKRTKYLPKVNHLSMGTNDSEYIFVTDESIVRKMKEVLGKK